jgi:hypothetical protein
MKLKNWMRNARHFSKQPKACDEKYIKNGLNWRVSWPKRIRMPLLLQQYRRKYPILRPKWLNSVWSTYYDSEKSTLISAAGFGAAVLWVPE